MKTLGISVAVLALAALVLIGSAAPVRAAEDLAGPIAEVSAENTAFPPLNGFMVNTSDFSRGLKAVYLGGESWRILTTDGQIFNRSLGQTFTYNGMRYRLDFNTGGYYERPSSRINPYRFGPDTIKEFWIDGVVVCAEGEDTTTLA